MVIRRQRLLDCSGFSLVELMTAMVLSLLILGVGVAAFSGALGSRERESSKTDAITSAQAALNVMSREIGNAGYGLYIDAGPNRGLPLNGIVYADSNANQLRIRSNIQNVGLNGGSGTVASDPDEDLTFYCESCDVNCTSGSVVRLDEYGGPGGTAVTSGLINRISDVDFAYYDVNPTTGALSQVATPSINTVKVNITLKVCLADVRGQPSGLKETLVSEVALRNSTYMLQQY